MNNLLIIDTAKIPKNPTTAHTRNALILSSELSCPVISTKEEIIEVGAENYKLFVIVGSAFYPETAAIEREIRKVVSPVIVWVNNEYSTTPNSEYVRLMKDFKKGAIIIANIDKSISKCKHYSKYYQLNLNTLIYHAPNQKILKKYNVCYYGSYRTNRRIYFQRYFTGDYIHVSSSAKNLKKFFQLAGSQATWCDRFSWVKNQETLNLFKYSLYIEDEFTHKNYNYLSNRFYESLSCNVVQFFDVNCKNTIEKSGIEFNDYFFVQNDAELKSKIAESNFTELLEFQSKWNNTAKDERTSVINSIKTILADYL